MKKDIKDYLDGDETGFYESNYGTEKDPCIYYHFQKKNGDMGNFVFLLDVLVPAGDTVGLFSFIQTEDKEYLDFEKGLPKDDLSSIFETVEQIKELEGFIMKLSQ